MFFFLFHPHNENICEHHLNYIFHMLK